MDGSHTATGVGWVGGALVRAVMWALTCVLTCALVLVFALAAARPALATSDATATLRLDRSEGSPGTTVTASVEGFAGCHAAGATGTEPGGGVVEIFWEGFEDAVGLAVVPANGSVEVPFSVPSEATAQKYSVVAVCMTDPKLTDDDLFVVTRSGAPVAPPSVTPSSISPSPALVSPETVPQTKAPQTTAPETKAPQTKAPQLVRVPRVVGLKVADAKAKLSALGLVPQVTSGDGDVVASQSPSTGSMVGVGHSVRITIKPVVEASPVVPIPNPAGGQAAASSTAGPVTWWRAALLSLAVLAFGAITVLVGRRWLDRRWVRNKLEVVVPPASAVDPTITETGTTPLLPVVRIESHADVGVHILRGID